MKCFRSHTAIGLNPLLRRNPVDMCPRCKVERTEENQLIEEFSKVEKRASQRDKAIKKLRKIKKPNSKQTALLKKLLERKNGYTVIVKT